MPVYLPSGSTQLVNSQTTGLQVTPHIASLSGGGFVTVWCTYDTTQDGSGYAIRAQRFDASGSRVGSEFLVNSASSGNQEAPVVRGLSNGGFVVVWQTSDSTQDGSGGAVKAQIFDANGVPAGGEFLVNTAANFNQANPSVTTLSDGRFVIAWETDAGPSNFQTPEVAAQIFNANGTKIGGEFLLNTVTTGRQAQPQISNLSDGGFVAVWTTGTGTTQDIRAQRFAADGTKVGGEIAVNTATAGAQFEAKVVGLSNGGFAIAWTSDLVLTDSVDGTVQAQIFDAAGTKVGAEFRVDSWTGSAHPTHRLSSIALMADGNLIIGWGNQAVFVGDGGSFRARVFTTSGAAVGSEFLIMDVPTESEFAGPIAALAGGGFVAISQTGTTSPVDYNIRTQIFRPNAAPELGAPTSTLNANELQTSVATLIAIDSDGPNAVSYSIIGGADALRFSINSSTGVLTFVTSPDFEAPTDSNGDNVYELVVRASDGDLTDTQTISVTVNNVNEAPVITSNGAGASAAISVAENGTAVTTVTSTDPENTAITYSIIGGVDAARFTINATTGVLSFVSAPNFEAPTDVGANNVYDVIVQASDGSLVDTQALAVTVSNVDEAPVLAASSSASVAEGTTTVATISGTDPEGSALTYSISGGADAALFAINAATGALSFIGAPDFEAPGDAGVNNLYDLIVSASDGVNASSQSVSVAVANVNEAPVITSNGGGANAALAVNENGTAVTVVAASDVDGQSLTYSIIGGADAALFAIDASTGALSFVSAPNFEAPGDAGADNVYDVVVQASDGSLVDTQTLSVTVGNVNEAVVITSNGGGTSGTVLIGENGTAVATVAALDPEGASISYSIAGGADAGFFSIDSATGALSFLNAPNFEFAADFDGDNIYDVIVAASDGTTSDTQSLAVAVADVNEAPVLAGAASVSVSENGTTVSTVVASDPEGSAPSYAISGGADAALFAINSTTGVLSFIGAPDYETPTDNGGDNVYHLVVTASDGVNSSSQALSVTVTNLNEAPEITSNGGGSLAAVAVVENSTAVALVTSSDPEGNPRTYAIVGGADAARFAIDGATGALSFVFAPNFEAPTDTNGDNIYDVIVQASDGSLNDTQAIAVSVTNANEAPVIVPTASVSVGENGTAVMTITASDPENAALTYSISGGADAARFAINAATGALSFIAAPDYEAPTDNGTNNVYDVVITASDGTNAVTQALAVTVTNANEAPIITSNGADASASISMAENGTIVTTVTSSDPEGTARTYSIVGGADAVRFTINATTGVLAFVAAPNFEAPTDVGANNVYDVIVQASDGTLVDTQALAISITNVNEAPVLAASAAVSVAENGTTVTTISASDPEGAALTYSISGGVDAARFAINAATGALTFVAAPNFEAPTDVGANNVYDLVVTASDGTNSATQALAVTVTNVNEAPVITSNGAGASAAISIAENGTAVTTVTSTDPENTARTYSIIGGADAARFTINATTGVLAFVAAPNFEAPTDVGANNVYDVIVQASDGTLVDTQALAITITNVNEAPIITSNGGGATASITINENTTAVTTVASTDPEGTARTYSIVGGADSARFAINATTGVLTFVAAPNYEAPVDVGANNVYDVIVRASDGVNTAQQAIAVTIANVVDGQTINGTSAANTLTGTNAEDTINGLGGNDSITGGLGADTLTGGTGADTFIYTATNQSIVGSRDVITDFTRSQSDRISLSAIDANVNAANDQAFSFIGTTAFSNVAGQLRYEQVGGNTFVYGDVNGDGIADLSIQLTGNIALLGSDFIL